MKWRIRVVGDSVQPAIAQVDMPDTAVMVVDGIGVHVVYVSLNEVEMTVGLLSEPGAIAWHDAPQHMTLIVREEAKVKPDEHEVWLKKVEGGPDEGTAADS